jgi:O-antigen/teichoic acid export membrane protein
MTPRFDHLDGVGAEELATAASVRAIPGERRRLLIQGLTWSAIFQVFDVIFSFAAMLVLVRLIPPGDYGRVAAVLGVLGLVNLFNANLFYQHALQLPEHDEPDWNLHWTWGFYIQSAQALFCHALAGLCWFVQSFRPIAPLLHIAAFGVFLDWTNSFGATMLQRQLDLRRLRIVAGTGMTVRLVSVVVLALAGFGAYAIVIGNNLLTSLPFTIDLLCVRGWRPARGWWRRPSWRDYRVQARFGLQRAGSNVIARSRGALEAALLPAPLGFAAMGLINRAQALYGATLGRFGGIVNDVVYPFLPRHSGHRERYAAQATLYLQVMLLVAVPGALFIGQQGAIVSRVLYGTKWAAMDPLIWPGALIGLAMAVMGPASGILLAAGRVRACLAIDAVASVAAVVALAAAWTTRQALPYSWALAAGQILASFICVWWASTLLERGWFHTAVLPPFAAALAGLLTVHVVPIHTMSERPIVELTIASLAFSTVSLLAMRIGFGTTLSRLLLNLPAGGRLRAFLLFRAERPQAPPAAEATGNAASS